MNYNKNQLESVIKCIENDLKIFCENFRLLNQNMYKYQQYKEFVKKHKQQKYDYSDILKLCALDFYIAEIEINLSIENKDYKNAYLIYNSQFKNTSNKEKLKLKINNYLSQYINAIKIKLKGIYEIKQRNSLLCKMQDQLPDEHYNTLKTYVEKLNLSDIKNRIKELVKNKNYKLAFQLIDDIDNTQFRKLCIDKILVNTKRYIQEIFKSDEYAKYKDEIEKVLYEYPSKYKEEIDRYYSEQKNIMQIFNKIKIELKNGNFKEADSLYLECANILDKEIYYLEKSKAIQSYFKNNHKILINEEQALALSKLAQNTLVTARAGSGKTRTIACRTILALEKENIKPDEILLLSFNRNAAEEMRYRIIDSFGYKHFDKNSARTFHSLAHDIVKPQEELIYDDGDKDVKQTLTKFIYTIYSSNEILTEEFKNNFYEYYRWTSGKEDDCIKYWFFKNNDEKYHYLRHKKKVTLNREKVKSNGEKWIADFLFEHDIEYKYEKLFTCAPYRKQAHETFESTLYHPDFTIWDKDTNTQYIIEHWGINEDDETKSVSRFWKKTWYEYHSEMIWKRKLISKYNTVLIETSVADLKFGRIHFEEILKNKLESYGIVCNKLSKEEILKRIEEKHINDLANKFAKFILYAQKVKYMPEDIDKKLKSNIFHGDKRCESFVSMANIIYKKYQKELLNHNKTDFDNILLNATEKIINSKGNCEISLQKKKQKIKNIKMILIDEYQDFSQLFFDMIRAIIQFNPYVKLFCVGDDWQSINAFAGSDLKFFKEFYTYFHNSEYAQLSYNYRSSANIVNAGNNLMQPEGNLAKYASNKQGKIELYNIDDVNIHKNNSNEMDLEFIYDQHRDFEKSFFAINHRYFKKCVEIISQNVNQNYFIMHREKTICHYSELERFAGALKKYFLNKNIKINISVNTIHKFKGMESDNVIILEATNDELPLVHPDSEFYLIFNRTPQMILDEEKRLFYVALTRAKENIYILTERANYCEYIFKIKEDITNTKINILDKNIDCCL
jgi:DNA helicase-4